MSKYVAIFLGLLLVVPLTACNKVEPTSSIIPPTQSTVQGLSVSLSSSQPKAVEQPDNSKILIAYFTWAENTVVADPNLVDIDAVASASVLAPGNTAQMATWIQQKMGGEVFSIVADEPYSNNYEECLERITDEKEKNARPAITNHVENIADYDVIFLGYPTWGYTAPMAIFSFIEEYDLSGKTVIPFCAHGTGGLANSTQEITSALPSSTVLTPIGVNREDIGEAQVKINEWLTGLNL